LFDKVLDRDAPAAAGRAHIVLVEAADRLLPGFHPRSSERARRTLMRRGVEVIVRVGVAEVTADGVGVAYSRGLRAQTTVGAAGVKASPLAASHGVATTRGGRIVVDDDLSLPGHPEVFVVGDIAATPAGAEALQPQVAQVAIQGGRH